MADGPVPVIVCREGSQWQMIKSVTAVHSVCIVVGRPSSIKTMGFLFQLLRKYRQKPVVFPTS